MEYNGFQYVPDARSGGWKVTYPSGWKTIIRATTEEALKALIDEVIALFGGGLST